jgi:NADP-dependent 3-hydroxy acid dehydrogenase YdfG
MTISEGGAFMQRLTGKIAWVTGAGSGIGEAGALALAREGASVMLTGRRKEPLDAAAARIAKDGGTARVHPGDMSRSEDASAITGAIEKLASLGQPLRTR